jgi:hypothetical protein
MRADDFQRCFSDPAFFRSQLRIQRGHEVVLLGDVQDPWQKRDFENLDPAWRKCMAWPVQGEVKSRGWLERPRGSSKTSDIATSVVYALTFAAEPIVGLAVAADKEQAGLIRDAIARLVRLNPWLSDYLTVQVSKVINKKTGSELAIISSDVESSWGHLIDFAICDELSIWRAASEALFHSVFSSVAKKQNALLIAIMNAGIVGSWQHIIRQKIWDELNWYFSCITTPASWIKKSVLDEQEKLLHPQVYARVWGGQWAETVGDAISEADIQAALVEKGPQYERQDGLVYFGGFDLSESRDRTGVVVIGRDYHGRLTLAAIRFWTPSKNEKIDLREVRSVIMELQHAFGVSVWGYDKWQASLMVQDLKQRGLRMAEIHFSGVDSMAMASELVEVFKSRRIGLFNHQDLVSDLRRLWLESRPEGYRLVAQRTGNSHCDLAIALALAVLTSRRHRYEMPSRPIDPDFALPLVPGRNTDMGLSHLASIGFLRGDVNKGALGFGRERGGPFFGSGGYQPTIW